MPLARKAFFDHVRPRLFSGGLRPHQVQGLDILLNTWEAKYQDRTPATQFAYVLATAYHETAATMQPIKEYGNVSYFTRLYDITGQNPSRARAMGNTAPGDGPRYCGRGFVQLTWKTNYSKATLKLRALGLPVDLVGDPDQAMRPEVAALILFEGMEEGWFTGIDLDDAIDARADGDEHADFVKARRIINGTDRAEQIARHADVFLAALKAGGL